jgi:hypothetical protein
LLQEFGQRRLERLQLHVAIGAPHVAIEADDQRALGEQVGGRDEVTVGIVEREGWRLVARPERAGSRAALDQLGGGTVHRPDHRMGDAVGWLAGDLWVVFPAGRMASARVRTFASFVDGDGRHLFPTA